MASFRKLTVLVPEDLLRKAQKSTGKGITATVRRGLELLAANGTYAEWRKLRGKIRFSVDVDTLREDRG